MKRSLKERHTHTNTWELIWNILTIADVFLNQKRVNVCQHTVKMAAERETIVEETQVFIWKSVCNTIHHILECMGRFQGIFPQSVMGLQWEKMPWRCSPYIQVSDVLCYKLIPIRYRTSLLQNSLKVIITLNLVDGFACSVGRKKLIELFHKVFQNYKV